MQRTWLVVVTAVVLSAGVPSVWSVADDEPPQVDFRRDVRPVLEAKCVRCHKPGQKKGALDMTTREAMLKGGNSGPAFVPGDSKKSLMVELMHFDEMPPPKEKLRITKPELDKIRTWIDAGAPDGKGPEPPSPSVR